MIAVIDYDAGNVQNVLNALRHLGQEAVLTCDPEIIGNADGVILPGVGAFGAAMERLNERGLVPVIREAAESGKPFLGICLGLQLLFSESEEASGVPGLSILPGKIKKIPDAPGLKIPHIGWNDLEIRSGSRLFAGIPNHSYVYFVHSYYLEAENPEDVAARTEYGTDIHAAVEHGKLFACQFHPEKSGEVGLAILRNFTELAGENAAFKTERL